MHAVTARVKGLGFRVEGLGFRGLGVLKAFREPLGSYPEPG